MRNSTNIFTLLFFLFIGAHNIKGVSAFQEKVYLHLDNNWYFTGDTIWYKAYTVRADNNCPSPLSRILYVELLNEQGFLVERQQLVIDYDGHSHGQFCLSDTAFAGYYELRAYTKWMLNFGITNDSLNEQTHFKYCYPNLFSRVIPVYTCPDSIINYNRRLMPQRSTVGTYSIKYPEKSVNVRFYPEGGNLINGIESEIAFEVENYLTKRINTKGVIYEDDRPIDTISCIHRGRGKFSLLPHEGRKYTAVFEYDGKKEKFNLPKAKDEGYVIKVSNDINDAFLTVNIRTLMDRAKTIGMSVVISCRGRISVSKNIDFINGNALLEIPQEVLQTGVNDIYLIDSTGNVLLNRKSFIYKNFEKSKVDVITDKKNKIQPYEKLILAFKLHNDSVITTSHANQRFSLAIRDKSQSEPSFCTGNIMTELLLQSDIKGFIETPEYYFSPNNPQARQHLDLLMMIQGWNRYEETNKAFTPLYLPEQSTTLSISTDDVRENWFYRTTGEKHIFCNLFILNDLASDNTQNDSTYLFKGELTADTLGNLCIEYPPFYGKAILLLKAKYARKLHKKNYESINHDPNIIIRRKLFYPIKSKQLSWYELNQPDIQASDINNQDEREESIYTSLILPTIEINDKRRRHKKYSKDKPMLSYDYMDFMNLMWDMGFYDKEYMADNQIANPFYSFSFVESIILGNDYDFPKNKHINFLFDGINVQDANSEILKNQYSFLPKIEKIDIITDSPRRKSFYQLNYTSKAMTSKRHGVNGKTYQDVAYVNIRRFKDEKSQRFIVGRMINLQGFNRPAEFYCPDYSKMEMPKVKDYRKTLYWNPNVITNSEGKATVEFFNNSIATELDISAEGITKDGKFIISGN